MYYLLAKKLFFYYRALKPTVCELRYNHNHETDNAFALHSNRVCEQTKVHLTKLFAMGHTPSSAYVHVRKNAGLNEIKLANRSITPDYKYIHRYVYAN